MEFAAICLRNALLLLPEEQQDAKQENGSKSGSQLGGNAESMESSETCRYPPCHLPPQLFTAAAVVNTGQRQTGKSEDTMAKAVLSNYLIGAHLVSKCSAFLSW